MEYLKKILLIEDDKKDIELTISALGENHLANKVIVIQDGEKALEYLFKCSTSDARPDDLPAVILLDLKMPKVDGIQILKQIKGHEKLKVLPVVILTSSRESRDIEECYALGVNAYVVKPVKFTEFVEAVKGLGVFWALINEPPPSLK